MSKNPIPGHDTVSLQFQLWSRHRTKLEKRKMKKIWRFLKFMLPCSKWDLFNTHFIKYTIETLPFFPPNHIIYHSAPTNPSSFGQQAISLLCLWFVWAGVLGVPELRGGVPWVYGCTRVPAYMGTWLSGAMSFCQESFLGGFEFQIFNWGEANFKASRIKYIS